MTGRRGHHQATDFGFDEESQVTPVVHFDFEPLDDISDLEEHELEAQRPKLLKRSQFLDREAVTRAAAKSARGHCGRRGLPRAVIEQMHCDYQRLGSLSKVGELYGRSRQSMYDIFRRHRLKMNERNFHARIFFGGRYWTPTKGGYYRATTGQRTKPLHHVMWETRTGRRVPQGWQVTFKDGDNTNFTQGNLVCLPIDQVSLLHYRRLFPQRAKWTEDQRREFWKKHYRELMAAKARAFVARGLRCDGKPRRRPAPIKEAA